MPYAILRFAKRKGGAITSIQKHNERQKEEYKSNPDIDLDRKERNYHIIEPSKPYKAEIDQRIREVGCVTRKDSVRLIETMITASPEFLNPMSPDKQRLFFERAVEYMKREVGEKNIISAPVHMDEKTPHMHLMFCPITKDGRLSAKDIVGNKKALSDWQTRYHDYMHEFYPKLERGESAMETRREHIPLQLFKEATRLDRQISEVQQAISDVNVLNAGKKRDEAMAMLAAWLPNATALAAQINSVNGHISDLRKKNKAYQKELQALSGELEEKKRAQFQSSKERVKEVYQLQETIRKQKKLLDRIPPEVLEQVQQYREQKEVMRT